MLPGLLAADYAGADQAVLQALGVRPLGAAEVADALAGLDRPPAWWRERYAALAHGVEALAGTGGAEAFAALPVPLADGRTVTGPRGSLLPDEGLPAEAVATLGLRVVHPDAAHPLLERLGARPASPAAVLADAGVRGFVAESVDEALDGDDTVLERSEAVLAVVAAAGLRPGEEPWLAELALPGADGEPYPAGELVLPGGPLAAVVEPDAPFGELDATVAGRHDPAALTAAGVLATFAVLDETDVDLEDLDDLHLDDTDRWAAEIRARTGPGPMRLERLRAVRDLEWVREDAWADAVALLGAPPLLEVLTAGCTAVPARGAPVPVPPYATWWLSRRPVLDGRRPADLRLPSATDLDGLYDPAPAGVDERLLAALGCRGSLADVLSTVDGAVDLLARLADPDRRVPAGTLPLLYPALAEALDGADVDPPAGIRVAPDRVADPKHVAVLDAPWLLERREDRDLVLGGAHPDAVADLLDVPLLSELD